MRLHTLVAFLSRVLFQQHSQTYYTWKVNDV